MKESIFDQLYNGIADAVADIREKVVEEPWFGRTVTEREQAPQWPQAQEPEPSLGSATHVIDVGPTHDQIGDNANYRLAATERDQSPQWPQAEVAQPEPSREREAVDREMER